MNLEDVVSRLQQEIAALREQVMTLTSLTPAPSREGCLSETTVVAGSNGKKGYLGNLFHVATLGGTNQLVFDQFNAGLCKITGGSFGNWTVKRYAADGNTFGDTYTGVSVATGHFDFHDVNDIVFCAFTWTSSTDPTPKPVIINPPNMYATTCKITGGTEDNWTVQKVAYNGDLYGGEYTGVAVASGHNKAHAVDDIVLCAYVPLSGTNMSGTMVIINDPRVN